MMKLLFINPELREGLNMTVRRGDKWFKQARLNDTLEIFKTGYEDHPSYRIATGQVVGLALIPFILIPSEWLAVEHDRACRNMKGLLHAMKRAYPDFNDVEHVTVLLFTVD